MGTLGKFVSLLAVGSLTALGLGSCGGGNSGSLSATTGSLSVAVTDAPVDGLSNVVVMFTGVEIQPTDGERIRFDFPAPRPIDLLALTGSDSALLLDSEPVPTGSYDWIRLLVQAERGVLDSYVDFDGVPASGDEVSLFIPGGGDDPKLKLNHGFIVDPDGNHDFTIDFDLRKSVNNPRGFDDYRLKPTLRIIDNTVAGSISGSVDPALIAAARGDDSDAKCAIYVFPGPASPIDDIDDEADGTDDDDLAEPLTTAEVEGETEDEVTTYRYTVGFLFGGSYTLALTCDVEDDDPESDDDGTVAFSAVTDVEVVFGSETVHDFLAP